MPLHQETRILPYTAEQMYAVVKPNQISGTRRVHFFLP